MMDKVLAKWRRVPYLHSILLWTLGILFLGDSIGAPYFGSDFRLRFTFICIAASSISFAHELIYKRKSLAEVRVSVAIFAPLIGLGAWVSLTFFDAGSTLGFLPLLVAMAVAFSLDLSARRKSRREKPLPPAT